MNKRIYETLELSRVKQMVANYLQTAQGQEELENLVPSIDETVINSWLNETEESPTFTRWHPNSKN